MDSLEFSLLPWTRRRPSTRPGCPPPQSFDLRLVFVTRGLEPTKMRKKLLTKKCKNLKCNNDRDNIGNCSNLKSSIKLNYKQMLN